MKLRLFYNDTKGYVTTVDDVEKVTIEKLNKVKYLTVQQKSGELIIEKLTDIELAYIVDIDTMQELFRYDNR